MTTGWRWSKDFFSERLARVFFENQLVKRLYHKSQRSKIVKIKFLKSIKHSVVAAQNNADTVLDRNFILLLDFVGYLFDRLYIAVAGMVHVLSACSNFDFWAATAQKSKFEQALRV
jgi:hypothetical protein